MAFWGIEVKPGKPVTHSCEKARGRLRISQATLGFGEAVKKSVVQCNVGNRRPVLLCVLLPGQTESSHLDLEFEEADDVVFSVIGPRSVYLTGYYVRQNQRSNDRSDTESYGVDIENTQSDGSSYNSDDDDDGKFGGSFIDDDELLVSPGSPVLGSQGLDEVMLENETKNRKGRGKPLEKKYRVIESDDDMNSPEKKDEDGFSLSLHESKRDVNTTTSDTEDNIALVKGTKDRKGRGKPLEKKYRVIESDDDMNSPEEKDEDDFSLSLHESKRDVNTTTSDTEENIALVKGTKDRKGRGKPLEKKCRVIEPDDDMNSPEEKDEDDFSLSLHESKRDVNTTTSDTEENIALEKGTKDRKGRGKPLEKKYRVIESDDDMNSPEEKDKDDFSLSLHESKRDVNTTTSDTEENIALVKGTKDRKGRGKPLEKKYRVIESDDDKNSPEKEDEDGFSLSLHESKRDVNTTMSDTEENIALVKETKDKKGRGKPLKKKYRVIESDDDANSPEKEDEDGFSLSLHESKRDVNTTTSDTGENIVQVTVEMDDEAKDDGLDGSETKQNVDPLDISDRIERVTQPTLDEEGTDELNSGKNEPPKQVGSLEEIIVSNEEVIHGSNTNEILIDQSLAKSRKKRKERRLIEKTSEVPTENEDPSVPIEHEAEASADLGIGEYHLVTAPELDSPNCQKSKKRRNELLEGEHKEGADEEFQNITEEDLIKQGSLQADGAAEHLLAEIVENEQQQKSEETSLEKIRVEYTEPREDEVMQEAHADSETQDLFAANEENKKDQSDSIISTKSESLANEQKIKKKRMKTKGENDVNTSAIQMSDNQENDDQSTKTVQIDKRTLSNGLTIEELESGPPGGKMAVPGKKIKIYYTGMLKESGDVFDSNVNKPAFKFQLGNEDFLEGWNVGIDGMHVGDKRRLIIPPSLGFGDEGSGEIVPPDSWLIYDIELVSVRG